MKVKNSYEKTAPRNSPKTSEMLGDYARIHPWKFQVWKNAGSQDMEPSMIWACSGSFWANSIFASLAYGSDLVLHIMIVWNSLNDLGMVSLMSRIINYA